MTKMPPIVYNMTDCKKCDLFINLQIINDYFCVHLHFTFAVAAASLFRTISLDNLDLTHKAAKRFL